MYGLRSLPRKHLPRCPSHPHHCSGRLWREKVPTAAKLIRGLVGTNDEVLAPFAPLATFQMMVQVPVVAAIKTAKYAHFRRRGVDVLSLQICRTL